MSPSKPATRTKPKAAAALKATPSADKAGKAGKAGKADKTAKEKTAKVARATKAAAPSPADTADVSAQMQALAARIEKMMRTEAGPADIKPEAVQALIAALCRTYSWHAENQEGYDVFSQSNPVTPTDVMVTASGLLKAANLAVFELGMWQSWTGR